MNPPSHEERKEVAPPRKPWSKPTISHLYQIEDSDTQPIFDPDKVGELANVYRGQGS